LEGILEKKGDVGVIKSFKKRYFVLRKDRLIYYESKDAKVRKFFENSHIVIGTR
jgi:hypothetical protein